MKRGNRTELLDVRQSDHQDLAPLQTDLRRAIRSKLRKQIGRPTAQSQLAVKNPDFEKKLLER